MGGKKIFVNLPVKNLDRSKDFFAKLGSMGTHSRTWMAISGNWLIWSPSAIEQSRDPARWKSSGRRGEDTYE